MLGPIGSWYQYVATGALAPTMIQRLKAVWRLLLLGAFRLVTSFFRLWLADIPKVSSAISLGLQTSGTLAVALLLVAFYAVQRGGPSPSAGDAP